MMEKRIIEYICVAVATSFFWLFLLAPDKDMEDTDAGIPEYYTYNADAPREWEDEEIKDWDSLIDAFIYVESRGDDKAVHPRTKATGCLQIMPILVQEANRLVGYDKYKLSDRRDREKSIEMFRTIQEYYNPDMDIHLACKIWNPRCKLSYHRAVENKFNELIKQ